MWTVARVEPNCTSTATQEKGVTDVTRVERLAFAMVRSWLTGILRRNDNVLAHVTDMRTMSQVVSSTALVSSQRSDTIGDSFL